MSEVYEFKQEGELFVTAVCGEKFAFKKWTWGEKNSLGSECTRIDPITNVVSFDSTGFNERMFLRTILYHDGSKYVPFTIEEIRGMDSQLGDRLFRLTQKLNLVSQVETKNL